MTRYESYNIDRPPQSYMFVEEIDELLKEYEK